MKNPEIDNTLLEQIVIQRTADLQRANELLEAEIQRRKLIEHKLVESEKFFITILKSISDAIFLTDVLGRFVYISPNVDTLFGFDENEIKKFGTITKLIGAIPEAANTLEIGEELKNLEIQVVNKSGITLTILVTMKLIENFGKKLLFTCRDITARKNAVSN